MTAITTVPILSGFDYEPLPSPSSSIRLAILQPGERYAPLKVTLQNATFTSRPKYKALSYTWGSPDVTKVIKLNGQTFKARKNLWDALLHLRHKTEEKTLWIDAICIDQSNIHERNQQVSLMSYIYMRAEKVIVWLGLIKFGEFSGPVYAGENVLRPTPSHLSFVCLQPYWKRVWIVQEIGAATDLEVRWETGISSDLYDNNHSWDEFFEMLWGAPGAELPKKLYDQRQRRHGDAFLLPNLMSVCRESLCVEPRDKIYGFVGIAHDCQDGSLKVDYSKSLFQLYEDVVRFQYKASSIRPGKEYIDVVCFSQLTQELLGGKQAMDEDFTQWMSQRYGDLSSDFPISLAEQFKTDTSTLKIAGRYAGKIALIGPHYEEMIGMPDAMRKWKVLLSKCPTDIEALRKKNEHFMRTLLEINDADLKKIASLEVPLMSKMTDGLFKSLGISKDNPVTFANLPQTIAASPIKPPSEVPIHRIVATVDRVRDILQTITTPAKFHCDEPSHRLFATLDGEIGILPPSAQIGDILFQFVNSDIVVIARVDENHNYCQIVGKAVLANIEYTDYSTFQRLFDFMLPGGRGIGLQFEGTTIPLDVDLMSLHLLTC